MEAIQAPAQSAHAAGMVLVNRDISCLGRIHGDFSGAVRDLAGKDQHGVDLSDPGFQVGLRGIEDPQFDTGPRRFLPVMLLQAVHAADDCDAHADLSWLVMDFVFIHG
jgi:hypothetical protein